MSSPQLPGVPLQVARHARGGFMPTIPTVVGKVSQVEPLGHSPEGEQGQVQIPVVLKSGARTHCIPRRQSSGMTQGDAPMKARPTRSRQPVSPSVIGKTKQRSSPMQSAVESHCTTHPWPGAQAPARPLTVGQLPVVQSETEQSPTTVIMS